MKFKTPLIKGTFIKRYKRFFADIAVGEETVVAHTANTGSMKNCLGADWPALLSFHDSPTRKLKYSFEMISNGDTWIGINTGLTNHLAIEAIQNGTIKELQGFRELKPEVKIGQSRIDILLSNTDADGSQEQCFVEVKNVTLIDGEGHCLFPDAVTERGQKHLRELMNLKQKGIRTVMLFIVQREDCTIFKIDNSIDPVYCELLKKVMQAGVEVLVYQCKLTPEEIVVHRKLEIRE
ncbi:MAG: DNA/RNA nuclease SfsA [Bacteriovorax sp.]|jgi:sugar fermentation stimulation protein A